MVAMRQVSQLPCLILFDGINFLLHCSSPRRVLLCFCKRARVPCARQIQLLDEIVHR
jgi:hypothetical protein